MTRSGLPFVAAIAVITAAPLHAVILSAEQTNQIAALTYQAAAAEASFKRQANAALIAQRGAIDAKVAELSAIQLRATQSAKEAKASAANVARLQREIAAAKLGFTAQLAEKDNDFARERAILLAAGEKLAETPQGLEALTLFNAGGKESWAKAKLVLAEIEATRAAKRRVDAGNDKRATATLYAQARDKGYETLASVTAKYEEVVATDPSWFWDWLVLSRLYLDASRVDDALRTAKQGEARAVDDRARMHAAGDLANVQRVRGERAEALGYHQLRLILARKLAAAYPGAEKEQRYVFVSLVRLGQFYVRQLDTAAALPVLREALAITRLLVAANPASLLYKNDLAASLGENAKALNQLRDRTGALVFIEESVAVRREALALDPSSIRAQLVLVDALDVSGLTYMNLGNVDIARTRFEEQNKLMRMIVATDPLSQEYQSTFTSTLDKLGDIAKKQGKFGDAVSYYTESLAIRRKLIAKLNNVEINPLVMLSLLRLGVAFEENKDREGARPYYEELLVVARSISAADPGLLQYQRVVGTALESLADMGALPGGWPAVVSHIESLAGKDGLLPQDAAWLAEVKKRATEHSAVPVKGSTPK